MGDKKEKSTMQAKVRKSAMDNCVQLSLSITGKLAFRVPDPEAARKTEKERGIEEGTVQSSIGMTTLEKAKCGLATAASIKSQIEKIYYSLTLEGDRKGVRLLNFSKFIKPATITFDSYTGSHGETKYRANIPYLEYQKTGESVADFQNRIGEAPTTLHWLLENAVRDAQSLWEDSINVFLKNYDGVIKTAKKNNCYNDKDYPPKTGLLYRFVLDRAPLNAEQAARFEEIHGMEEADRIIKQAAEKEAAILKRQSDEVLSELLTPLDAYLNALKQKEADPKRVLHSSLQENLLRGVSSVRAKSNDPKLEKMCVNIEATIGVRDIADLKKDSDERVEALTEASTIQSEVEDYCKDVRQVGGIAL